MGVKNLLSTQYRIKERADIMKFCPECGTKVEGLKFCPECGNRVNYDTPNDTYNSSNNSINTSIPNQSAEQTLLEFSTFMFGLEDKHQNIGKGIDLSLPQFNYILTNERLFIIKKGYIGTQKEEIELYKIKDVRVKQGIKDKVIGIGTIEILSVDETTPIIILKQIKNPEYVKEAIRSAVRNSKANLNIHYRQEI